MRLAWLAVDSRLTCAFSLFLLRLCLVVTPRQTESCTVRGFSRARLFLLISPHLSCFSESPALSRCPDVFPLSAEHQHSSFPRVKIFISQIQINPAVFCGNIDVFIRILTPPCWNAQADFSRRNVYCQLMMPDRGGFSSNEY